MVFPFSRSGLKLSGIRYITIGLRRGRVDISVHFAGLFVAVAVGRYKPTFSVSAILSILGHNLIILIL